MPLLTFVLLADKSRYTVFVLTCLWLNISLLSKQLSYYRVGHLGSSQIDACVCQCKPLQHKCHPRALLCVNNDVVLFSSWALKIIVFYAICVSGRKLVDLCCQFLI
jgi:hypothetical protein